jgi:hypothetical protein
MIVLGTSNALRVIHVRYAMRHVWGDPGGVPIALGVEDDTPLGAGPIPENSESVLLPRTRYANSMLDTYRVHREARDIWGVPEFAGVVWVVFGGAWWVSGYVF